MIKYVCGFLFNLDRTLVKLILKDRPQWQAGNFNGIGGKIEPDEGIYHAMSREFLEEGGVDIRHWDHFCVITGTTAQIYFFRARVDDVIFNQVRSMESEQIHTFDPKSLPSNAIENIPWLVPMALMGQEIMANVTFRAGDDIERDLA